MIDASAFARLICDWCLEVQAEAQVLVVSTTLAQEPVLALHRQLLARGAWPLLRLSPPSLAEDFYNLAQAAQLDSFAPLELTEVQQADAFVRIDAPANTRALAGIHPSLVARAARGRAPIQEARLGRRWCGTLWPTAALAQQAGMGELEYAEFVRRALFLDRPDPVAAWAELSQRQQRVTERLATAKEMSPRSPAGSRSAAWS